MQSTLIALFLSVSTTFSLPPGLLSALCFVESNHKVHAVNYDDGGSDSIGVCQIKLHTARLVGFKGTEKQLRRPEVNAYYAGAYLRYQLDRYDGDIRKAVAAYNAGTHRENHRGQTLNRRYVSKVLSAWADGK